MPAGLTTTSYAILGLLAIKPWTTYELAGQMRRALGHFWPRAESKLYEEPKKLVAHGLARATSEKVGNRPRTVYTITPKGRRALAAWVPTPSADPLLEFEHLVKIFFAEHGTKSELLTTIRSAREWAEERFATSVEIPRGYLEGKGPFPERLPWLILAGQFLTEFTAAVHRWAEWAEGVVAEWPDDVRQAQPDWATLKAMAEQAESYARQADSA
ncbi:MAG TPA: PadR family transcriptional regulator [Acidimicrobiales bacterium]|nr:PadR family transcriptional regulator [Acidimicrobiales bacterium]